MSVALAAEYPGVLFSPFDGAVSSEAVQLRREFDQVFTAPCGLVTGGRNTEIAARLVHALEGATNDGIYATADSLCRALVVMQSLPNHTPVPDVVVEADGEIGLDWDLGRRRVLSISVGEGPMLRFAALINSEPVHGRVAFAGVLPGTLSFFLNRILASR
jgi:hypothetical protein